MTPPHYPALAREAAARYDRRDRFARGFASGKLNGDPVFRHLLGEGLFPAGARVLDVGCGQGLLAALLAAARRDVAYRGIDLLERDIARATKAVPDAHFECGDVRTAPFGAADVVVMLDVLHYLEPPAQEDVLRRARAALASGGTLLLRVADADGSLRFRWTELADHIATLVRTRRRVSMHWRRLDEWRGLLEGLGFAVEARPMSEGTGFANVLLVARYHRAEP